MRHAMRQPQGPFVIILLRELRARTHCIFVAMPRLIILVVWHLTSVDADICLDSNSNISGLTVQFRPLRRLRKGSSFKQNLRGKDATVLDTCHSNLAIFAALLSHSVQPVSTASDPRWTGFIFRSNEDTRTGRESPESPY